MSLPLPQSFHVETPTCTNPACDRRISSDGSFCAACWHQLSPETKRRISAAHNTRNRRCVDRYINRALRELKKTQERKDNAVSQNPMPTTSFADRPGYRALSARGERGISQ